MKLLKTMAVTGLMIGSIAANAGVTNQDITDFQNKFGGQISTKNLKEIAKYANEHNMAIDTALNSMKSKKIQGVGVNIKGACCYNVSGQYGDFFVYNGAPYCAPSCH